MENKSDIVTKLIKTARTNGFKFGTLIKAPEGFRWHSFEVQGGDVFGYGIEIVYVKSVPEGSEKKRLFIDFASLLLSKKFMKKLLYRWVINYREHYNVCIGRAHDNGINEAVDYLYSLTQERK